MDSMLPDGSWTEITVDSGAAENVSPLDWAPCFATRTVRDQDRLKFVGPNGSPINHFGSKDVFVKVQAAPFQRQGQ